jgi:hypothetical protein
MMNAHTSVICISGRQHIPGGGPPGRVSLPAPTAASHGLPGVHGQDRTPAQVVLVRLSRERAPVSNLLQSKRNGL